MEKYCSYKDSGVQWLKEIPSHWEEKRLKDVLTIKDKRVKQRKDLTLLSLTKGGVIIRDLSEGKGKFPKDFDTYKIVEPNDLIMCLFDVEETPRTVGVARHHGMITGAYDVFSIHNMEIEYLNYYLQSLDDRKMMKHLYKGLRNIIPMQAFMSSYIPVPPLEEQQSMVSYLDKATAEIDKAIAQQQHMIDLLNERKQIIIQHAVTKGLDENVEMKDSGVEWIGDIPAHWDIKKFKTIACVKSNLVHPKEYQSYPQVSPDNIEKNNGAIKGVTSVYEAGVISDNHLFYKGQILYSKIRPTLNKVAIAPYDGLCSADMYPIETTLDTDFLQIQMLSDLFVNQVAMVVMDRVKMPKINKDELGQILVVCPPFQQQRQIVASVKKASSVIDQMIKHTEALLSLLQERKQIIISEVVTGKIKVS